MTLSRLSLRGFLTSKPVLLLEIVILLFFGFKVTKEVLKKRAIEREISRLEADIGRLTRDQDKLSSLLSYVRTDGFVEQEAREKLNLAKEGESLLLAPQVDAASSSEGAVAGANVAPAEDAPASLSGATAPPASHLKLWWRYFFDRERLWED